jgi:uncharacterized SAM-binding protein YcdF (DUF218 family)
MFLLKQFLKVLILPPGCWLLALVAVLIFWKRRWARKLLLATVIVIFALHSDLAANGLGWLLESRYRPLLDPRGIGPYDAIVVLTAGVTPPSGLVVFARLSEAQIHRLEEAIRLYRLNPRPIVISGGHVDPFEPPEGENDAIAGYLHERGVPREHVVNEAASRDTFESALELRKILKQRGWRRYLLVTSATHLPRSMMAFARLAPDPIPAPADFKTTRLYWSPLQHRPSEEKAQIVASALNEYYGLLQYRLRLIYDGGASR